jgi:hypothetical protein
VLGVLVNREATREALASFLRKDVRTIDRLRDCAAAAGVPEAPSCRRCGGPLKLSRRPGAPRLANCGDNCTLLAVYERRRLVIAT